MSEALRQNLRFVLVSANTIQGILSAESHRPRCLAPGVVKVPEGLQEQFQ